MLKGYGRKPIDADVDGFLAFLPARQIKIGAAWCTGADKHCVVGLSEDLGEAVDVATEVRLDTHIEDIIHFLVEHFWRQPEARDLAAHEAATEGLVVVEVHLVTQRREIPCDGQGCGARTDQRDALAVLNSRNLRQAMIDGLFLVCSNTLEAADGDRVFLYASASACRFTRSVAGSPQHTGKHIGFPVNHVGVAITLDGDESDVLGYGSMCGTTVLAVHDLMEILRITDISRFHRRQFPHCPRQRVIRCLIFVQAL